MGRAGLDPSLAGAVGDWMARSGPLYVRLANTLRSALNRGEIPAGVRLPPERVLAEELGVSRTTVAAAYDLLREDSWVERRQGSGTWTRRPQASGRAEPDGPAPPAIPWFTDQPDNTIHLRTAAHKGFDGLPRSLFTLTADELEGFEGRYGYALAGLQPLRRAVAECFARQGLPTNEEQILITSGGQQAIALVAALFLRSGDWAVVENPTYAGATEALRLTGARLVSVPLGHDGPQPEAIQETVSRARPKLVFLVPTFHSPTGALMPEAHRRAVAGLAEESGIPIVEDNALADLLLEQVPPPPIAAFARTGTVITIGSMSKLFWAGLRIGWVRAAEPVIHRLALLRAPMDAGSPLVSQIIALRLMAEFESVQRFRRTQAMARLELLAGLLREHLPSWSWRRPSGGPSVWVRLPQGRAVDFERVALRYGVTIAPGPLLSPDGTHVDHLRLPLLQEELLREGIPRLGRAWRAYLSTSSDRREAMGLLV